MYLNNPVVLLILVNWITGNFSDKLLPNTIVFATTKLTFKLVNIIRFKT